MQKAANLFYRMCLCLTFAFCSLIFVWSLDMLEDTQPVQQAGLFRLLHRLAVPAAFLMLAVAAVLFYRNFGKWLQRRSVVLLLFLLLILAQVLYLIFVSHPMYTTDTLKIQNEAAAMVIDQGGRLDMDSSYFQRYPNNHFIVLIFYYYYAMLRCIGITDFWVAAIVLNIVCIDSAIFLTWLTVCRLRSRKAANLFLLLSVLCPTTYVWLTFVYTNTVSMPFVMGILYLFLRLQRPSFGIRQAAAACCCGVCIVLGCKVRPTTILPVIAMGLYGGMKMCRQICGGQRAAAWNLLIKSGIAIFAGVLTAVAVTVLLEQHVQKGLEDKSLPATHWIMMGLNDKSDGSFIRSDVNFSERYPTKALKKQAHWKEIQKRLKTMGVTGYLDLVRRKIGRVWSEGSDSSFYKAAYAADYPVLYEYVMGRDNFWFRIYTQCFRSATFFFTCVSTLILLLRRNWKDVFVYTLTLLGCIAFFILWEANSKYNICFIYLCLLLMTDGIQMLETGLRYAAKRSVRKQYGSRPYGRFRIPLVLLCLCCTVLLCFGIQASTVSGEAVRRVYQAELKGRGVFTTELLEQACCIRQTIQEGSQQGRDQSREQKQPQSWERDWNEMALVFQKSDTPQAKDRYHAALYAMPEHTVLYEADITAKDLDERGSYTICTDIMCRAEDSYYVLELTHRGKKYSMYPSLQNSAYLDMYPYGIASIDGHPADCDLCFALYQNPADR